MCNECNGNYNNCPVCGEDNAKAIECEECEGIMSGFCPACNPVEELETTKCLKCNGHGKIGYDEDGEEWEFGTEFNTGGWDRCEDCHGEGEIRG